MSAPAIFICYSHKDKVWKDRLVTQLGVLELDVWDDRRIAGGDDWFREIEQAIGRAGVAILLISAEFLTSTFILREEVPRLLERRQKEGLRVIPLIVRPCAWKKVKWLSSIQARPKDGQALSRGSKPQYEQHLADLAEEVAEMASQAETPVQAGRVCLAKMPSTRRELFGRECELKALDAAWDNPHINIFSLVAFGGIGKTALVNVWLNRMQERNWRGVERVFGWSFYSQGAAEGRQTSADPFIAYALRWFDDPEPDQGTPWDKGERLAELVRKQRTLLVLDGLEPLQQPPDGGLKDPALQTLLRELARDNPGLCVLTTRLAVDDLKELGGSVSKDLESLEADDGAKYLEHLGVKGTPEELREVSREMGGHALALTLLGTYLAIGYDGDIRRRDLVPRLTAEAKQGGHARRVMRAYEQWFEGKPEEDILRLMGLFDRPADAGAIATLRRPPAMAGLTDRLQNLSDYQWNVALGNLRQARLLAAGLDCHPLVREYFGDQLRSTAPAAWQEAHGRLYEHYKARAKEYPDTIEEMAPLYAAVAHGCQAGRHQKALEDVYRRRIQRGNEFFSTKKLGAIGAELAVLAGFFDPPWEKPVAGLRDAHRGWVLNEVGFALRALGRIREAVQPMKRALAATIALGDWSNAARYAGNLSELHLTLSDVRQAVTYAEQSVELADRSGDAFLRLASRTTLADALHQAGRIDEAERLFQQAEEMQKESQPGYPLLYSLWGFRYCDLLLAQGKHRDVQDRATQTLAWAKAQRFLLDIALDDLSLGRAFLLEGDLSEAESHLDEAVVGLRQAGTQHHLPLGLLARAALHRLKGDFARAQRDVDEALLIATRSGMRLYEADCHLEQARLSRSSASLAAGRKIVKETGYHRRDAEVAEIEKQLSVP